MTTVARQHIAERQKLPPSDPRFRNLDSLIAALDEYPRQPRRAVLKLRKRLIERAVPAYEQGGR